MFFVFFCFYTNLLEQGVGSMSQLKSEQIDDVRHHSFQEL